MCVYIAEIIMDAINIRKVSNLSHNQYDVTVRRTMKSLFLLCAQRMENSDAQSFVNIFRS